MGRKLVVIGLDGATFDIIKPLINEGKLPVIASLISEGVSGELQSTLPPISSAAWTSFLTGMNPGKHGIFHFLVRRPNGYGFLLCNSQDIRAQTIFSSISAEGKTIGAINIPITYPPEEINGFIVSGIPVPPSARDYTYPSSVLGDINKEIGDYTVDYDFSSMNNHHNVSVDDLEKYEQLLESLKEIEDRRLKTALHLMKSHPSDAFMVVLTLIDRVQHYFWRFMDKRHAGYTEEGARRFGRVILDCYEKMDEALGVIVESSGKDTTFIIMSDHGAGPHYSNFYVNKWLADMGWLRMKACPRLVVGRSNIQRVLTRLGLGRISKKLPASLNSFPVLFPKIKRVRDFEDIKWSKTRAYSALYGISVNLKGREDRGVVEPGDEYNKIVEELKALLCQLVDPQTGETLVEEVFEGNQIYAGPYSKQGPDLLFQMKGISCVPSDHYNAASWFETRVNHAISGTHRMNGIFVMKGEGIIKTCELRNLQITDVAPTMLYLLQVPIPKDMDGRVMVQAFTPEFLKQNDIRFSEDLPGEKPPMEGSTPYSAEEEHALKEFLKGLGYLN